MSVTSEILRLQSVRSTMCSAISQMGGTVASDATFSQCASAILTIPSGIDTRDATALSTDIISGKTAYVSGQKITGTIPTVEAQAFTPGTAPQYLSSGVYLGGSQTIQGDPNLVSGNIKKGVSIFGVQGNGILGGVPSSWIGSRSTLTAVEDNEIDKLDYYAFYSCKSLTRVSLSSCRYIGERVFYGCSSLAEISLPNCRTISSEAFRYCQSLVSISFPLCNIIYSSAFAGCYNLRYAQFPSVDQIGAYAFYNCYSFDWIAMPKCREILSHAFEGCSNLTSVYFYGTFIGQSAFCNCWTLLSFYLSTPYCELENSMAFYRSPIGGMSAYVYKSGSIYIPSSLYSHYLSASVWSFFSSRMVSY